MKPNREPVVWDHVKVELRSRSPRLWGWSLCNGIEIVVERSDTLFRYAEDAWIAGQAALTARPPPAPGPARPTAK